MKTEIPEKLKADLPHGKWGKVLSATPVVMTVLATVLAGLASSEMTRAQYDRALAAQLQSKAGDQWGLFQAKRMRSSFQATALDLLNATVDVIPLDAAALSLPAEGREALELLQHEGAPKAPSGPGFDPAVQAALDAVGAAAPESKVTALLAKVDSAALDQAVRAGQEQAAALDAAMQPAEKAVSTLASIFDKPGSGLDAAARRGFAALRMRHASRRYDAEAQMNGTIANLYELQVRKDNLSAERHHNRSQRFFYGMLGLQMAVVISTLAIAARQRGVLWSLAAAAGLAGVSFAVYVFLSI
jgi:hypothetical protein